MAHVHLLYSDNLFVVPLCVLESFLGVFLEGLRLQLQQISYENVCECCVWHLDCCKWSWKTSWRCFEMLSWSLECLDQPSGTLVDFWLSLDTFDTKLNTGLSAQEWDSEKVCCAVCVFSQNLVARNA